jgi:hypothetical protein
MRFRFDSVWFQFAVGPADEPERGGRQEDDEDSPHIRVVGGGEGAARCAPQPRLYALLRPYVPCQKTGRRQEIELSTYHFASLPLIFLL